MEPSRELRDLVLGFYHDMSTGNSLAVDLFSSRDDATAIGTDPREWWIGGRRIKAISRTQMREMGPVTISPGDLHAFQEGSVGWVVDNPTTRLADGTGGQARVTFVFHREGGHWKVVHEHWSQGVETTLDVTTSLDAVAYTVEIERPSLLPALSPEGTVTIAFTDMEASTATNEALGDDLFLPLLLQHNEIVEASTVSHGGTVVKSQGDGFMLAFPSARRGIECAIAVQREVVRLEGPIKVRMGLHTGEPIQREADFFGRDVAYAARLGSAARGSEILVSSLVKSLVEPSGSFTFDGPRDLELKGFDGPQPVYSVVWR